MRPRAQQALGNDSSFFAPVTHCGDESKEAQFRFCSLSMGACGTSLSGAEVMISDG
jgi:hypothetical protein